MVPSSRNGAASTRAPSCGIRRSRRAARDVGYLGHMWELYAMWTWMALFASASLVARRATPSSAAGSARSSHSPWLVRRHRLRRGRNDRGPDREGATWRDSAMIVSGAARRAQDFSSESRRRSSSRSAIVWGVAVVADSSQFSALVVEYSPRSPCRNGAHRSTVQRLSADDGVDSAAARRRGSDRMAVGIPCARPRSRGRHRRHACPRTPRGVEPWNLWNRGTSGTLSSPLRTPAYVCRSTDF